MGVLQCPAVKKVVKGVWVVEVAGFLQKKSWVESLPPSMHLSAKKVASKVTLELLRLRASKGQSINNRHSKDLHSSSKDLDSNSKDLEVMELNGDALCLYTLMSSHVCIVTALPVAYVMRRLFEV